MYEHEQVEEAEAQNLANELHAIFQKTSAKDSTGVEDLFVKIGKKILNPKSDDETAGNSDAKKNNKKDSIKLNKKNSDKKGKKGCC